MMSNDVKQQTVYSLAITSQSPGISSQKCLLSGLAEIKVSKIILDNAKSTTMKFSTLFDTFNESYNFAPYILADRWDNKSKASTNFSFIQRENSCQNPASNFISKGRLILE